MNATVVRGETALVSDEDLLWFERTAAVIMLIFNLIGVFTNAINIRVFINQGLSGNSITISFFSLAIADLGCSVTMLPYSFCYIIEYIGYRAMAQICSTFHLILTWQARLLFAHVTCWITVYISLERSISVIMPLKVKNMFKPRETVYAMVTIWLSLTVLHVSRPFPTFRWTFSPTLNQTVAVFYASPTANRAIVVLHLIYNNIVPSFLIVFFTVSLSLMVYKLNAHKEFRKRSNLTTKNVEANNQPAKRGGKKRGDSEILKAIALVSGVFLFCKLIGYIPGLIMYIYPNAKLDDVNRNLNMMSFVVWTVFDSVNSAVNLFIYMNVSSNYREAFYRVYFKRRNKAL